MRRERPIRVPSRARGVTTLEYVVLAAVLVLGVVAAFTVFRDRTSDSVTQVGEGVGQIAQGHAAEVGEKYRDQAATPGGSAAAEPENAVPPPVATADTALVASPAPAPSDDGGGGGFWSGALDVTQVGLDVVGLVPGLGEIADGANGLISLGRGDYVGAGLSFGAMIPFAGWGATATKFGRKGMKLAEPAVDAAGVVRRVPPKVVRHGPMNPGPLPDKVARTFRSGTYDAVTTTEPTKLYRVYSDGVNPTGAYWTRTKPSGPVQAQIDSALDPNWGNKATDWVEVDVPAGTTFYEGSAAQQRGLVGGGNQVFLPGVPKEWITGGGKF